jgi:glycosyltransferase involved in cell wall biosynthesis
MKVLMLPHIDDFKDPGSESGIRRVIEAYFKYLPQFGVEMLPKGSKDYDVLAVHAGCYNDYGSAEPMVSHNHGLYWTAMYDSSDWEFGANANVIRSIRYSKQVTVPSSWVAETFQRDMHFTPHVVPHGIEWDEWQNDRSDEGFVIGYNKNRKGADVCNPRFADELAIRFPSIAFVNTFSHSDKIPNITLTGLIAHTKMKQLVKQCSVYVSTVKETGGIGILEAMAAGKPILGFRQGGILDWCEHGVNSYLADPNDMDDLEQGLHYCIEHRIVLGENAREAARQFTWEKAAEKVTRVYELVANEPEIPMYIDSNLYRVGKEE